MDWSLGKAMPRSFLRARLTVVGLAFETGPRRHPSSSLSSGSCHNLTAEAILFRNPTIGIGRVGRRRVCSPTRYTAWMALVLSPLSSLQGGGGSSPGRVKISARLRRHFQFVGLLAPKGA